MLLMGAMAIASVGMFTSCKDYDDDISANRDAIAALRVQMSDVKSALEFRLQLVVDLVMRRQVGARTDQTHRPAQYVEQLRRFVEARLAHEPADRSNAGVGLAVKGRAVGVAYVGRIDVHRTELEHFKRLALISEPFGVIEDGAAVGQPNDRSKDQKDQTEKRKPDQRDGQVEKAFEKMPVHQSALPLQTPPVLRTSIKLSRR